MLCCVLVYNPNMTFQAPFRIPGSGSCGGPTGSVTRVEIPFTFYAITQSVQKECVFCVLFELGGVYSIVWWH